MFCQPTDARLTTAESSPVGPPAHAGGGGVCLVIGGFQNFQNLTVRGVKIEKKFIGGQVRFLKMIRGLNVPLPYTGGMLRQYHPQNRSDNFYPLDPTPFLQGDDWAQGCKSECGIPPPTSQPDLRLGSTSPAPASTRWGSCAARCATPYHTGGNTHPTPAPWPPGTPPRRQGAPAGTSSGFRPPAWRRSVAMHRRVGGLGVKEDGRGMIWRKTKRNTGVSGPLDWLPIDSVRFANGG